MIEIDGKNLDLETALTKEWIEANDLGGYASSTVVQCHTRKYHGLLVANLPSHGGRQVLLSKVEDSLVDEQTETHFSVHKYPMVFSPEKIAKLQKVEFGTCLRFIYQYENSCVEKDILLCDGEDTLPVSYTHLRAHET